MAGAWKAREQNNQDGFSSNKETNASRDLTLPTEPKQGDIPAGKRKEPKPHEPIREESSLGVVKIQRPGERLWQGEEESVSCF